jgi:hypothetical protein
LSGFLRVLENLKTPGILANIFQAWKSPGIFWVSLKSFKTPGIQEPSTLQKFSRGSIPQISLL